ncbi:MAG: hypothetical protein ACP5I1_15975 [Candidatus Hinthialibacter sp.]
MQEYLVPRESYQVVDAGPKAETPLTPPVGGVEPIGGLQAVGAPNPYFYYNPYIYFPFFPAGRPQTPSRRPQLSDLPINQPPVNPSPILEPRRKDEVHLTNTSFCLSAKSFQCKAAEDPNASSLEYNPLLLGQSGDFIIILADESSPKDGAQRLIWQSPNEVVEIGRTTPGVKILGLSFYHMTSFMARLDHRGRIEHLEFEGPFHPLPCQRFGQ